MAVVGEEWVTESLVLCQAVAQTFVRLTGSNLRVR